MVEANTDLCQENNETWLNHDLKDKVAQIELVDEVSRIITSTLDIERVYGRFAQGLKRLVEFDRMTINLVDLDADTFTQKNVVGPARTGGFSGQPRPLEGSQTGQIVSTGRMQVRDDLGVEPPLFHDQEYLQIGLRSMIGLPLVYQDRVIGSLVLRSHRIGAFGPREQGILKRLAEQISPAVENAKLYQRVQQNAREMALIDEVAGILSSTLDIDEVYERFALGMKKLVDFDRTVINLIDEESSTATLKYRFGPERPGRPLQS